MDESRTSNRFTFSIRAVLILTGIVALHVGVPILGRALFATIVAAIVLSLVSVVPLAAVHIIWRLVKRSKPTHAETAEWIGKVYFGVLALVYVSVALTGCL